MHSDDQTNPPAAPTPEPTTEPAITDEWPPLREQLRILVKVLLAGNPFYIASAALLLYGISGISKDARLDAAEEQQLIFNFSSLLGYEALLVVTAIGLARRRIWYDSTLLVGLENMLVFVPFILIGQAALIGDSFAWATCLTAFGCALAKGGALRRFMPELDLSPTLLVCGLMYLVLNLTLPLYYREIIENDAQAWQRFSPWLWLLVLPALQSFSNMLPRPHGGVLWPQRTWIPIGMTLLWAAASAVHLRALDYVDNIPFALPVVAPLVWALAWTLRNRLANFVPSPSPGWQSAFLHLPALATLLALPQVEVFFGLNVLNTLAYLWLYGRDRADRSAAHLLVLSAMAAVAAVPESMAGALLTEFSRERWVMLCFGAQIILMALLRPDPKTGLIAGMVVGIGLGMIEPFQRMTGAIALQGALVFTLIHSLRWRDQTHPGAAFLRFALVAGWLWHAVSLSFAGSDHERWLADTTAGILLIASAVKWFLARTWQPWMLPVAGGLVFLLQLGRGTFALLHEAPPGYLAIGGAFLLFALGTALALTKPRWLKSPGE